MAHDIRDLSSTGFYLLTEERWYPGTLVLMTLQGSEDAAENADRPEHSISVQAMAIRQGKDGVGLQFVPIDTQNPQQDKVAAKDGATKKALDKFLQQFLPNED